MSDGLTSVTLRTCPNPVFVIGSPRSGTSVLPWALAHSADFWTTYETEFIHGLFGQGQAGDVYEGLCQRPQTFITGHGVDHKEFYASLGLGINALISSRSEGQRWIDQSPGYTTMAWLLADMFPGAYFIHMLRDGRSVVNSMVHFGEREGAEADPTPLPGWATDFETAAETWNHYVEFALHFCAHYPDRALTVKNEDLVRRTEEEFERLFTFLGSSYNPEAAEFFRSSRVNSSFVPLAWHSARQAEGRQSDLLKAAADAWRDWSPEQRETFEAVAGDLLQRLGYPAEVEAAV